MSQVSRSSRKSLLRCPLLLAWAATWLTYSASACGRLGFELHDLDAGAAQTARGTTSVPARSAGQGGKLSMDAGISANGGVGSLPGAWIPDSGKPPGLDNAAACSGDDSCASGACVAGVCCESHCDEPPQCYVADGASCSTGQCAYRAADSGTRCDDANSCSKDDRCEQGSCSGRAQCDDAKSCTKDFCAQDSCAHASTCQPAGMPCSYAQRFGHGYWLCPGPVTFDAGSTECRRIGAKLVTIDNESEQRALWQLGMRDTWIGYRSETERDSDAGFDWVDGESNFEDWAKNRVDQADADDDEDAGTLDRCAYLATSQDGAWRSHACDDKFAGFACELEQYAPPESACSYERRGSHGYFSCPEQRTWLDAAERCAASAAYLVELDDAEEQAFVLARLKAMNKGDARYSIGVTDAKTEGHFQTMRGGALHYTAWAVADGEPSTASADNDFGVLTSAGTWRSVGPAEQSYYICEQDP